MIDFTPPFSDVWPITADFQAHQDRDPPSTAPGLDIAGPHGTPILAIADGKVFGVKRREAGGLSLWIDHGHGYRSYYAHLSAFTVVNGDRVKQKDVIGYVGSTGHSTGPHLHCSVKHGGEYIDPLPLMEKEAGADPQPAP